MAGKTNTYEWKNPTIAWFDRRLPIFSLMRAELVDYPTPRNLNYWWNFGSLAGIVLVMALIGSIQFGRPPKPEDITVSDALEGCFYFVLVLLGMGWLPVLWLGFSFGILDASFK